MRNVYTVALDGVAVKVHRLTGGEYRARLYLGGVAYEAADYYTSDEIDALATADSMLAANVEKAA